MKRCLIALALILFVLPEAANACSVCWGGASNSPWIGASIWVFLFLLALTYGVIGGGVVAFVVTRRRAIRKAEETQ